MATHKIVHVTGKGQYEDVAGLHEEFLCPGEFYFTQEHSHIHTILGSCIAITLWHPHRRIGGMCHFVLPGKCEKTKQERSCDKLPGRYSHGAMELFQRAAYRTGTELKAYEAKIFGGSNMLTSLTLREDEQVGTKNTEIALRHLTDYKIPLLVAHVGETGYRRIKFDVRTGDVWVKHEPIQKNIS